MSKVKPKTEQKTSINSWLEADSTLKALGVIAQKRKKLEGEMNLLITQAQEKFQPQIDALNTEALGLEKDLELFASQNRSDFGASKTKELSYGSVSFRMSTPSLKTLKGFTWDAVKNLVKASRKLADKYIKVKEDLNKQALLSSDLKPAELAKIGCVISQEETFYYEIFERN